MILTEFGPIQQAAARVQNQNNSGNNSNLSWLLFGIISGCIIGYRISQWQKNNPFGKK